MSASRSVWTRRNRSFVWECRQVDPLLVCQSVRDVEKKVYRNTKRANGMERKLNVGAEHSCVKTWVLKKIKRPGPRMNTNVVMLVSAESTEREQHFPGALCPKSKARENGEPSEKAQFGWQIVAVCSLRQNLFISHVFYRGEASAWCWVNPTCESPGPL